ncbi:MAG: hypothetical protein K9N23_17315 [Akkermansiaceae bacterium]|nr:hypothetical protein [Akkermansiaceae bacterium]MCF7733453.1 hypothetical protein [Akkermansiaceae bacterium]
MLNSNVPAILREQGAIGIPLFHLAEREGLPSLTLGLNGDPLDNEVLDNFAFEVHSRFRRQHAGGRRQSPEPALR